MSDTFEYIEVILFDKGISRKKERMWKAPIDLTDELLAAARSRYLAEVGGDPDLRVVIFSGSEKSFISGADIAELRDRKRDAAFMGIA